MRPTALSVSFELIGLTPPITRARTHEVTRHPPSDVLRTARPPEGARRWPGVAGRAGGPGWCIALGLLVPVRGPGLRQVAEECGAHRVSLVAVAKVRSGCLPGAGG